MPSASPAPLRLHTSVLRPADEIESALAEHVELARRLHELRPRIEAARDALVAAFGAGGRVYAFGNGGSAADAAHFAEELLGRYKRERRPLPAQSLAIDATALTCIANDFSYEDVFDRQVRGFVRAGDVVAGFTTSGRSSNVVRGLAAAQELGATTILFGGGGPAAEHADVPLVVPSESTARIQEMHVLLVHLILEEVDAWAARPA
jgi:D-sedoheptulose 7-phosphate isomerase